MSTRSPNTRGSALGVVTVTFNAEAHFPAFLRCCKAQIDCEYELLIIDNASADGTLDVARDHQDARFHVIENASNVGYAEACNQGIAHFQQRGLDSILFINNDTEFDETLFLRLTRALYQHDADAVTPHITYFDDLSSTWYGGGRFSFWKGFQGEHLTQRGSTAPQWVEVAPGCCVAFRMDTFRRVGVFDPAYFVYFEDTDLFLRMRESALRLLYLPDVTVAHKVSLSTGGTQSDFSIRFYQRNQIYILRKHFSKSVVIGQLIVISAKILLRRALGRDTNYQFRLRLLSIREGFAMPVQRTDADRSQGGHDRNDGGHIESDP